jgi:hypothetical protein
MPGMRNVDNGFGDKRDAPAPGVREPAQVRYPRKRREGWPFRFYQEGGRIYENYPPRRERKPSLDDLEEALM